MPAEPAAVEAAIGLGGNVGDKRANLDRAVERLSAVPGVRVVARSGYYRTEPWGFTDQDWFLNACVVVETTLSPADLLAACLAVETSLGRRRAERWGPRIIDLDILTFGDRTIDEPGLAVPHPRLMERAFVLAPLAEVRPDLRIAGVRVADALAGIGADGVERLDWTVPAV
jgi:2-amino-4-hydroxy-6-hydroxymethyldihydropteridine diphosphokinase